MQTEPMELRTSPPRERPRRPPTATDPASLQEMQPGPAVPVRVVQYDPHRVLCRSMRAGEIAPLLEQPGVTWLDIVDPSADDLKALAQQLGLDERTMSTAVRSPQRPKYMVWSTSELFVIQRRASCDSPEQISLMLGDRWLLTIRWHCEDPFGDVRERIDRNIGAIRGGSAAWLAAALIASLIDAWFEQLQELGEKSEQLEHAILIEHRFRAGVMRSLRERLVELSRVIEPIEDALRRAAREASPRWDDAAREYLREIGDDTRHLLDAVESRQREVVSLTELELSSLQWRTNSVVTLLTVVSALFLPLSFLVNVWGLVFSAVPGWRLGHLLAWAISLAFAGVIVWFMQRRGWLRTIWEAVRRPELEGE